MARLKFSIVRFVPSPVRNEAINLGLIVGSDQTNEWVMELVQRRTRATKIDEENIFPSVAGELDRLQAVFDGDEDRQAIGDILTEAWLEELSRESQNVLQFTRPELMLADSSQSALEQLWDVFIVEPETPISGGIRRNSVIAKCWTSFESAVGAEHLKRRVQLHAGANLADIDIAVHNGVAKQLTQCWSFQVKDTDKLLNDVKAWGWTIRRLRSEGGCLSGAGSVVEVPDDVRVRVVYAPQVTEDDTTKRAQEVFADDSVGASFVTMDDVEAEASAAAQLLCPF